MSCTGDDIVLPLKALTASDELLHSDPLRDAREVVNERTHSVYKIVLTGGPCAGKTMALTRIRDHFRDKKFRVFTVPEAATSLFTNGASLKDLGDAAKRFAFQWSILCLQINLEDAFERVARTCGEPSIILCDRGLMDGSVYIPPQQWSALVKANGLGELNLRDGRYDAILHLVTAACGAEDYYSLENNDARTEDIVEAREVESKTQAAWVGHPRHFVFDNSTDFEAKLKRVMTAVSRVVGLPCLPRKQGKFLLARPPPPMEEFPEHAKEFDVEKVFLQRTVEENHGGRAEISPESDGPAVCISRESFLERRGREGQFLHEMTTITSLDNGTLTEVTRRISGKDYKTIEQERGDKTRCKVSQRRVAFLWENQVFELQTDVEPAYGTSVLYRREEGGELTLPAFLKVDE